MHKNTITLPHCLMYLVNILCLREYYFVYLLGRPHTGKYATCCRGNQTIVLLQVCIYFLCNTFVL